MKLETVWGRSQIEQPESNHYQIIVSTATTDREWDRFVEACPGGKHVQASFWSELKQHVGWQVRRLMILSDGKIVAGAQMLIKRWFGGLVKVGYVTKGPLFLSPSAELATLMIAQLQLAARVAGVQVLFVQPPLPLAEVATAMVASGFAYTNLKLLPTATVVNDLSADLDTLLKKMRKKTRNCVRRGYKEGLTVREGTHADLPIFYDLHCATSERRGFQPAPFENFEREWSLLNPLGHAHFFIVEFEGTPIAANWVIAFGDTVWATRAGWSGEFGKKRPNEVMDWHSISWAKQNEYRYYDLEGIAPEAAKYAARGEKLPPELRQSSASYKLGLGGGVVFCPQPMVFIGNRLLRRGYQALFRPIAQSKAIHQLFDYLRAN